ncbi:DMT family transporter [Oxalobacter sp. OttesenSCG-928-P03]|nr:DMT family transporter [Oxalobacter sp. OttesenSCG-928-P03]
MTHIKPIDGRATGLMTVICIIWGMQQVAMKSVADVMSPLMQISIRSGLAALMIWLLMRYRGERIVLSEGTWKPGLVAGGLFALEFLLAGEGLRHTTASHMGVFLYTAPIFAALGLQWRLREERLQRLQWAGIVLAFAGVAITFTGRASPDAAQLSMDMLWGDFLGLLAGAAWGATTVVIRTTSLARASTTQTILYQLVGAFVLLSAATLCLGQQAFISTPLLWGSLFYQIVIVSFFSYLLWFWLLHEYLASRLGVLSFMTPLFSIIFGVWLLDEPLESTFLTGAFFVLVGIALVNGYEWIAHKLTYIKKR